MAPLVKDFWISVNGINYCQILKLLAFNAKSLSSITFKGNVTAFLLFDLVLITVIGTMAKTKNKKS